MSRRVLAGVVSVARMLLLAYVGYLLLLFVVQRRMAFPGVSREPLRARSEAPSGVQQIWLETSFGPVEGWLYPVTGADVPAGGGELAGGVNTDTIAARESAETAPAPAVIFAHGNGELIDDWEELRRVAAHGVHVLAVEYPGYGHSAGRPTRATVAETFSAAFDTIASRNDVDAARIVAWGRSMGGGAAGDLASARPVAALVLQSTFSSAARIARESFAPGFLVRDRFDTVARVREFNGPVLLMHGPGDEVIGYRHAERIAAAREGLSVTPIACGHNDCGRVWPDIVETVVDFLAREGLFPR